MKADIDRLMEQRGLDAILVAGGEEYSAVRYYMTNGADITGGLILKKRGDAPLLVVGGMEIEEAQKSGLNCVTTADMEYYAFYEEAEGDVLKATTLFWQHCLKHIGVPSGKVGVYGTGAINQYVEVTRALDQLPEYSFVGEIGTTLFDEAFLTKDADEIARIKSVADRTAEVIEAAWKLIASHKAAADETVVNSDGKALTIGDFKRFVRRELLDRELEDTGMIFAQGRDAGYPHSRGEGNQPLKLGQSIVFDLFPRELGGGYHHDMTRTWCIGYAPEKVQKAYNDVMEAFDIAVETFGVDKPTHLMQEAVLNSFESKGHPTSRNDPKTMKGYVHSLGHGVGINIHERPSISHLRKEDVFQIGNCITIEPGLYYPDEGFGVRVEDLFIVNESGELVSFTPGRKDLVLPLEG